MFICGLKAEIDCILWALEIRNRKQPKWVPIFGPTDSNLGLKYTLYSFLQLSTILCLLADLQDHHFKYFALIVQVKAQLGKHWCCTSGSQPPAREPIGAAL